MKEDSVPVQGFTNNNFITVPGKAVASNIKWLAHSGFGMTKKGRQERSLIFVK